jgi:hypothetical protein
LFLRAPSEVSVQLSMNIGISSIEERHPRVQFAFKSRVLETELDPLCQRVLRHFQRLPAYKLLCYIDDEIPSYLPAMDYLPLAHRAFSGLHVPTRGGGRWPHHVQELLFTRDHEFAFDNLIYIPGTEYARDPITFVMILAHEFRHFVQYGESELAWKVNRILFDNLRECDTGAMVWDVPDERDAMIVSKHVTEEEFGTQAVDQLMERHIADANANGNVSKREVWTFFRGLSSSAAYNWRKETSRVIQKYRSYLEMPVSQEQKDLLNTWVQDNSLSGG